VKTTDSRISRSSKVHPFATIELFGLSFLDAPDEIVVAEHLATADHSTIDDEILPIVFTPNVDVVVQLERAKTRGLGERLAAAAYILPDGAPIVWTSRWARTPLAARIAGSTVFHHWWPRVVADERRVVVLCSTEEVKIGLETEYPAATVVVAPMIDTSDEQVGDLGARLVEMAVAADAEFCVIGIGHPKDAMIALSAIDQWPDDRPRPLMLCLGASAEFHVGTKTRAPDWAQRHGLEWMVRFAQEPKRMFYRYFVRDLGFFPMAFREAIGRRRS
jgi:N-acetylglucosaminyldiphosphoundecaprenol N-acetyl-beta-D-mannosaminyltransferase